MQTISTDFKNGILRIWKLKSKNYDRILFDGEEGFWELSPDIYQTVFNEMPSSLCPEEKGLYVYSIVCKLFSYNVDIYYKRISNQFDKEKLESFRKDSSLLCFDFARVFVRLISMLHDDRICAVILANEKAEELTCHLGVGFVTQNFIIELEPMAINLNEHKLSDFANAKMGFPLTNIKIILGSQDIASHYIDKIYNITNHHHQTPMSYVRSLHDTTTPTNLAEDNLLKNIYMMIESMKQHRVRGQEFIYMFSFLNRNNFFKTVLSHKYIGQLVNDYNGLEKYRDNILITTKTADYLIDAEQLTCTKYSKNQISEMFENKQLGTIYHHQFLTKNLTKRK